MSCLHTWSNTTRPRALDWAWMIVTESSRRMIRREISLLFWFSFPVEPASLFGVDGGELARDLGRKSHVIS